MSFTLHIASPRLYGGQSPVIDRAYKRFIRQLPCCACGGGHPRNMEAAHFGPRGLGQKANDRHTLPLCRRCHQTSPLAYHQIGPVKFALAHKIDVWELIEKLNRSYDALTLRSSTEPKKPLSTQNGTTGNSWNLRKG